MTVTRGSIRSFYLYIPICLFLLTLVFACMPASNAIQARSAQHTSSHTSLQKKVLAFSLRKPSKALLDRLQIRAIQGVAHEYMQSLVNHDYAMMWSLLNPHISQKWPNESAFATFWHTRFQDYVLKGFTIGSAQAWPDWTDPDTLQRYTDLQGLSISLQLALKPAFSSSAQLAPEQLHPEQLLRNLPLVVQYNGDRHSNDGHWLVLIGGPADLEAPLLPPVTPLKRTVAVPILMYHHVLPLSVILPGTDYAAPWVVSPANFMWQMDYLASHGYHPITLNRMFNALYYGGPLPTKPVVLTFDDGDEDHYRLVYPILLQHHFTAMFYIITGQVGLPWRVNWSQLREMLAHGMQVGSHTVHHVDFALLLNRSLYDAQQEIQQSRLTLEQNLGISIQQFCYPFGDPFNRGSWEQRQLIMPMLAAAGYIGATTAFGSTGIIQDSTQPFALLRIPVYGYETLQQFTANLPLL